jgi:hypothetical protein
MTTFAQTTSRPELRLWYDLPAKVWTEAPPSTDRQWKAWCDGLLWNERRADNYERGKPLGRRSAQLRQPGRGRCASRDPKTVGPLVSRQLGVLVWKRLGVDQNEGDEERHVFLLGNFHLESDTEVRLGLVRGVADERVGVPKQAPMGRSVEWRLGHGRLPHEGITQSGIGPGVGGQNQLDRIDAFQVCRLDGDPLPRTISEFEAFPLRPLRGGWMRIAEGRIPDPTACLERGTLRSR